MVNLLAVISLLGVLLAKPVEHSQKVAVMDDKDKMIGYGTHKYFKDDEKSYPDPPALPGISILFSFIVFNFPKLS